MPRAPLFSVSLAFGLGCLWALGGAVTLTEALILWAVAGLLWLIVARREQGSLAAFYLFVMGAGMAHTLLLSTTVAPHDLRRLSDEKLLASTQWQGVIQDEPIMPRPVAGSRRTKERASFVVGVEMWRPTSGRLFGAEMDSPWQPAQGLVRCMVTETGSQLHYGDRIEFAGALVPIPAPLSPGEFDAREWEARQGVYYQMTIPAQNWRQVEPQGGNWLRRLSFQARDWAYARLQLGLEDDPSMANFLAGMLIGYRQAVPADIELDFRKTGTVHVFAVSGQNIAEMVVVAMVLLQLCGFVRWRWAWIIAPVVLLYCLLTGSPPSAIRATVMALTILLAWRLGRPLNALGCWSLAFLGLLIWDPRLLLDPGAQLSFGVVLGLILIAPPITRFLMRPFHPDPFLPVSLLTPAQRTESRCWWFVMGLIGTAIAAALVSEPITAVVFHQVTPISILANLVVVPVAGLITVVGTLSVTASLVSSQLAILLNNTNWLLARGLIAIVAFLAHEPGASVNVADLRTLETPLPSIVVAPLRDSACLLVRDKNGTWLFNAGRDAVARSTTSRLLQFYGINRLNGLGLTQKSVADNGGTEFIARDFHPAIWAVPSLVTRSPLENTLEQSAADTGGHLENWQRGESHQITAAVRVEVLSPASTRAGTRAEDRSLVLLVHVGGQTLLWAGRIGADAQAELRGAYPVLHADVLVMGTEPAPSPEWLKWLGVAHWLQIPPRDRWTNGAREQVPLGGGIAWPLNQTGAVEIRFQSDVGGGTPLISLRPWVGLPGAAK